MARFGSVNQAFRARQATAHLAQPPSPCLPSSSSLPQSTLRLDPKRALPPMGGFGPRRIQVPGLCTGVLSPPSPTPFPHWRRAGQGLGPELPGVPTAPSIVSLGQNKVQDMATWMISTGPGMSTPLLSPCLFPSLLRPPQDDISKGWES